MASQHLEGETLNLLNDDNVIVSSEIGMVNNELPLMASDELVNVVPLQGVVNKVNAEMIEKTFKAEIDHLKLEVLQRDSRINWLQDRVDLWSNEVIRLTHHCEDNERWLCEERAARRHSEWEVQVHARELAVARMEAEKARCAQDEILFQMRRDNVESVGSANSAT